MAGVGVPRDDALEALFVPFETGALVFPKTGALRFLRARAGPWSQIWRAERSICEQGFKPFAAALERDGLDVVADDGGPQAGSQARGAALVLVLPPRQRDEARALFARAVRYVEPGGTVVASVANNGGARAAERDLEALIGPVRALSKHKCRVFWGTHREAAVDRVRLDEWLALDAPTPIQGGRYLSRRGLFAWDRVDPASALLIGHLPTTLAGRVADLGAGYGYLAAEIVARCPAVTAIDLYEAEDRALAPAAANLAAAAQARSVPLDVQTLWHDVTLGVPRRYDVVVSNPPFHQGRADQPELGRAFISAAARALRPAGAFWMVANRHLPYEATLTACFAEVRTVCTDAGFKVFEATRPRGVESFAGGLETTMTRDSR